MYHIKPDKRSQTSAGEILRGMQLCLREKPLREITVTDIHRAAGVSRATFYRLFDTPEDVLVYRFDTLVASVEAGAEIPTSRMMLEQTIAIAMQYHEFFKAVVGNGRFDLLYRYTADHLARLGQIYDRQPPNRDPVARSYILSQLSMSMVAALITWEKNGRKETAAQIAEYMREYINAAVHLAELDV